jgi:hypothetical protein
MPTILEHIMDKLPHFRIVIDNENRAPLLGHTSLLLGQDAEKAPQLRSRLIEILNVPEGYASCFDSPAALLEDFLSILRGCILLSQTFRTLDLLRAGIAVPQSAGIERQRLVLCAGMGQGCSGAKGHTRSSLSGRNATLCALLLRFLPTNGIDLQRQDQVSGRKQPCATTCQITRIVAAGWHWTGSEDGVYFTLEKSATILASVPS